MRSMTWLVLLKRIPFLSKVLYMAKMTFLQFKNKLEYSGSSSDIAGSFAHELDFYDGPYNGNYQLFLNGKEIPLILLIHNVKTNELFAPNSDGELLAEKEFKLKVKADQQADWKLLKASFKEV